MKRFGFIYDREKCIGCNVCQMACKDKNNLEAGLFFRQRRVAQGRDQHECGQADG